MKPDSMKSALLTPHAVTSDRRPHQPDIDHLLPYTPGESLQTFSQRTGIPANNVIKLNANESPYGPVPSALQMLRDHAWYNQYPDVQAQSLTEAISRYTGLEGAHIVLGHGSMEVIRLLWSLFLSPGDEIITCSPTFSLYTSATRERKAYLRNIPRRADYSIDLAAVLAELTPAARMIVLCSPNNPTGNPLPEDDLLTLLKTGLIVVVDEAYVEFSSHPTGYAHLVPHYQNLVVMRTFSKWAGLAGLRVGYGLFPQWIVSAARQAQYPFAVNVAGHLAATATLNHLDEARERVQWIIEERERLSHVLAGYPFLNPIPSEGNFILARIDHQQVSLCQFQSTMEKHGLLLRYFPLLDGRHDYVRVTVGLPEHTTRLAEAIEQIRVTV
ncbi:histidinol-phosphate aminotransferase [Dictyobacter sp. S3.2.2.5]|uniref:Histidinol-phosphate aminotransferase n=1 Tax=Dictyobacter halimunensis TaxID=3026934 RepID=A0ABQ6FR81_9CHLR|nr:histidinol-phosphate aminotransferase [Dictyobacter sp. S3.2.2.5]